MINHFNQNTLQENLLENHQIVSIYAEGGNLCQIFVGNIVLKKAPALFSIFFSLYFSRAGIVDEG